MTAENTQYLIVIYNLYEQKIAYDFAVNGLLYYVFCKYWLN